MSTPAAPGAPPDEAAPRLSAATLRALVRTRPFDPGRWDRLMAADCHVRIGNDPPAVGKPAALRALAGFLGRIEGIGGGFCEIWKRREALYVEADIAFTDALGRPAAIPCAIVAREVGGALKDLRLHLDPTPLPPPADGRGA